MSFEILHLGHFEDGDSDKVWGACQTTNPDGRKTGFRFWGKREGSLTFRICQGDGMRETLDGMWWKKRDKGYDKVPAHSDSMIESCLGAKFMSNLDQMRAQVMLAGVDTVNQNT